MNPGLISVVMPAFEEEAFIADALSSVLAQSYAPVEVIVVDDGSLDHTAEIAERAWCSGTAPAAPRPGRGAQRRTGAGGRSLLDDLRC